MSKLIKGYTRAQVTIKLCIPQNIDMAAFSERQEGVKLSEILGDPLCVVTNMRHATSPSCYVMNDLRMDLEEIIVINKTAAVGPTEVGMG